MVLEFGWLNRRYATKLDSASNDNSKRKQQRRTPQDKTTVAASGCGHVRIHSLLRTAGEAVADRVGRKLGSKQRVA